MATCQFFGEGFQGPLVIHQSGVDTCPGDQDEIESLGKFRSEQAKCFAEQAFAPITLDRVSLFARDTQADAGPGELIAVGEDQEMLVPRADFSIENAGEVRRFFQVVDSRK